MVLQTKKKKVVTPSITTTEKGNTFKGESTSTLEIPSVSRYSVNYSESTMSGLFFILRGQYCKKGTPVVVEEETMYLGGYDPTDSSNREWYIVMDRVVFHCIYCGSDFTKALYSIKSTIERCKDTPSKYFKEVSTYSSEDFYEVHYKHKVPLSTSEISKKAVGRQPRTSEPMWLHYMAAYTLYGHYYSSSIERVEEEAQEKIKEDKNPMKKNRKLMKKLRTKDYQLAF